MVEKFVFPVVLPALVFTAFIFAASYVKQKQLEARFGHSLIQPSSAVVQARH